MTYAISLLSGTSFKYPDVDSRKPRVPVHTDRPQPGAKSSRNFVTTNAMKTVLTVPKEPNPRYVDRPTGSAFNLEVHARLSQTFLHLHSNYTSQHELHDVIVLTSEIFFC